MSSTIYLEIDNTLTKNLVWGFIAVYDLNNSAGLKNSQNKAALLEGLITYLSDKTFFKALVPLIQIKLVNLKQKIFVLPLSLSTADSKADITTNYNGLLTGIKAKTIPVVDFFEFKCLTQSNIEKNDSLKSNYEEAKAICAKIEISTLEHLAILSVSKPNNIDPSNAVPYNVNFFSSQDDIGVKMNSIKISEFSEDKIQDPSEWIMHSVFLMDTVGLREPQQVAKLCSAITDIVLRSSVISQLQTNGRTLDQFKATFLDLTFQDKAIYLKELQTIKFDETNETATKFYRKLQRLVCKSLHKDLSDMDDEVVNLMTAVRLRSKLPYYIINDTGFLTHPGEDISLAKLADKLLISKSLNKNRISEFKQTTELNSMIENLVNNKFRDVTKNSDYRSEKRSFKSDKNFGNSRKTNFTGSCYYCGKGNHIWGKCFKLKSAQKEGKDTNWSPKNKGNKAKMGNDYKPNDTSVNFIGFENLERRACSKSTVVKL